jgi:ribonuclease G
MLLDEEREHVASLSEFIGKPISLQVDPALGQEQFDIILV